jgi:hypothetical protein
VSSGAGPLRTPGFPKPGPQVSPAAAAPPAGREASRLGEALPPAAACAQRGPRCAPPAAAPAAAAPSARPGVAGSCSKWPPAALRALRTAWGGGAKKGATKGQLELQGHSGQKRVSTWGIWVHDEWVMGVEGLKSAKAWSTIIWGYLGVELWGPGGLWGYRGKR